MRAIHRSIITRVAAVALLAGSVSCGDVVMQDRAPVLVVIDSMEAASGADPGTMGGFLLSDVQTLVEHQVGWRDGSRSHDLQRRRPGDHADHSEERRQRRRERGAQPRGTTSPINRYHISFLRADGRNTPGVDVPFPVDGAVTATLGSTPTVVPFEMVRHQQKLEQPLRSLANFGGRLFISTIAEITFYGADQAGNALQIKGTISVSFSDYADPE